MCVALMSRRSQAIVIVLTARVRQSFLAKLRLIATTDCDVIFSAALPPATSENTQRVPVLLVVFSDCFHRLVQTSTVSQGEMHVCPGLWCVGCMPFRPGTQTYGLKVLSDPDTMHVAPGVAAACPRTSASINHNQFSMQHTSSGHTGWRTALRTHAHIHLPYLSHLPFLLPTTSSSWGHLSPYLCPITFIRIRTKVVRISPVSFHSFTITGYGWQPNCWERRVAG